MDHIQNILNTILENTEDSMFSLDRNYCYTSFNKNHAEVMKSIYGVNIEPGKNLLSYMSIEEDREKAKINIDRTLSGETIIAGSFSGDEQLSRLYFEISHFPVYSNNNCTGVLVISKNITGQKRAELKLAENTKLLNDLIDNSSALIYIVDKNGKFIKVNSRFEKLFDLNNDEITGKVREEILPAEIAKQHFENDQEVIRLKNPISFEEENIEDDGVHFYHTQKFPLYDVENKIYAVGGISIDITDQINAEKALRESEGRLRSMFETIGDVIFQLRVESDGQYRFIAINQAFVKTTGIPAEMIIGKLVSEVIPEPSLTLVLEKYHEAIGKKSVVRWTETTEYPTGTLTGDVSVSPVFGENGKCIYLVGSVHDLTDRIKAEKALKESEERLRLSTELANVAVWEFDFRTNSMSRSANHDLLYGLPQQETWRFETFVNATHPDDREYSNAIIQKSAAPGGPEKYAFDFRVVYPDQSIHWLMVNGQVTERGAEGSAIIVRGTLMDITGRKQAEIEVGQYSTRMKQLLGTTLDGYMLFDTEGNILEVNPAYCNLTGYENIELLNMKTHELEANLAPVEIENLIATVLRDGKVKLYTRHKAKNGDILELEVSLAALYTKTGPLFAAFVHDITELIKAQESLKESEVRLENVIRYSTEGIAIFDETGKIIYWNLALEEITLIPASDTIGRNIRDIQMLFKPARSETKETSDIYFNEVQEFLKTGNASYAGKTLEWEFFKPDGFMVIIKAKISAIKTTKGFMLVGIIEDITKQKEAEQKISLSNKRYQSLFNDSPIPLWEEDFTELMAYLNKLKNEGIVDFRAYFDNNPDELEKCSGMIVISDVNQAALNLHKAKNIGELQGNLDKIFTEKSFLTFKEEIIAIAEGKITYEAESEVKTLDGETRFTNVNLKIDQSVPEINRAILATIDITRRKEAEAAVKEAEDRIKQNLVESEKRYRALFENINAGFVLFEVVQDDNGVPVDLLIVAANKLFEKTTGLKNEEVVGKQLTKVLPGIENDKAGWIGTYGRIALTGESRQFEQGSELLGYYYSVIAFQAQPKQCAVTFLDITENKLAREEINTVNQELRSINQIIATSNSSLNSKDILDKVLEEAIKVVGLEGGAICLVEPGETLKLISHTETSEATVRYLTENKIKTGECLCGKCAQDKCTLILNTPEEVLQFATHEVLQNENIKFHASFPFVSKDKCVGVICLFTKTDKKPSQRSLKLIETISGNVALSIENALLFDTIQQHAAILERKVEQRTQELSESQEALINLLEDLNEKKAELEKSSKMLEAKNKALETFTYSVSHDLKAPLRGIDGYGRLLQENYAGKLSTEGQLFVKTIRESTHQMNQLIEDLLAYSRLERGVLRITNVKIKDIIDNILLLFKNEIKTHNVSVSVDVPDCEIRADNDGLSVALRNIIENAIKFTGNVKSPEIIIELKENVYSWVLSVKDNGIGFDMKYHNRIFEIFQRLHLPEQYKGTGIGLAMVNKSMERMGGKVWAESQPGEGAVFYLELQKN